MKFLQFIGLLFILLLLEINKFLKRLSMFRVFNSIQFVGLFAGMPYLISWLNTNPFPYANTAAMWTAIVGYLVMFFLNVAAIVDATERNHW